MAMRAHQHSNTQAAEHLGVSRRTILRWKKGEAAPRYGLQRKGLLSYIYWAQVEQEKRARREEQRPSSTT